jgi:hypothetical protein
LKTKFTPAFGVVFKSSTWNHKSLGISMGFPFLSALSSPMKNSITEIIPMVFFFNYHKMRLIQEE